MAYKMQSPSIERELIIINTKLNNYPTNDLYKLPLLNNNVVKKGFSTGPGYPKVLFGNGNLPG